MSICRFVRSLVYVLVLGLPSLGSGDTSTSLGDRSGEGSTPFTGLVQSPEANLFTGASTTRFPIALPPGRKNMTPQLALQYSSTSGPSPYGYGWDLPIGRIERNGKWGTPACVGSHTDDFVVTLPTGSVEMVNDPPGSDTYLPRHQEGYLRARKFPGANYWEVTDRGGIRYMFGQLPSARVGTDVNSFLAQSPDGTCRLTALWALTHVEDPNGNAIDLQWARILNVAYPIAIDYGGNAALSVPHFFHVAFVWEGRPDMPSSARSGVLVQLSLRLSALRISSDRPPAGIVRTYTLTYDADTAEEAVQSRLNRVDVSGDDWPQQFAYSGSLAGHGSAEPLSAPGVLQLRQVNAGAEVLSTVMDMTGDGLPDLVNVRGTYWEVYPGLPPPAGGFASTPLAWSLPTPTLWHIRAVAEGGCSAGDSCIYRDTFDITGDGIPDYVDAAPNSGQTCKWWKVYVGTPPSQQGPGGFARTPIEWPAPERFIRVDNKDPDVAPSEVASYTIQDVMDLNGDGLPDLIHSPGVAAQPPFQWDVYLNTGSGFAASRPSPCAAADFQRVPSFPAPSPWIERSAQTVSGADGAVTEQLMDFNGDGLLDLVNVPEYDPNNPDYCSVPGALFPPTCLDVYFNTGQGFSPTPRTSALRFAGNIREWYQFDTINDLLDINGDGFPDSVTINDLDPQQRWMVQLNHAGQLDPLLGVSYRAPAWPGLAGPIRHTGTGFTTIDMIDVDGDGLLDRVTSTGGWRVQRNLNPVRPNLLSVVRSGVGGTSTLRYQPSTVYDNTGGDLASDLPFITWVVDGIRRTDGLCSARVADPFSAANPCIASGNEIVSEFTYQDGRFDAVDREFRGFRQVYQVDRNDPDPSNATSTIFAQTPAIKGRMLHVARYAGNPLVDVAPILVAEDDNTWGSQAIGSAGRTQVWLASNAKRRHDLPQTASQQQTTANARPDAYGNVSDVFTFGATAFDDLVHTHTDFAVPAGNGSVYDRPAHILSRYLDATGFHPVAERWFYYDGGAEGLANGAVAAGNVKKVESLADAASGTRVAVHSSYDGFGNVVQALDERHNARTTTYDAVGLYPALEANALNQLTVTVMDYRWGKPISVTDANHATTTYAYDAAGRLRCVGKPGDSVTDCTNPASTAASLRYTYHQANGAPFSDRYSWVKVEQREPNRAGGYLATTQYFDAFGRTRYVETPRLVNCATAETLVISGDTEYDAGGRAARKFDPYAGPFPTRDDGVSIIDYHLNGDARFLDPLGRPFRVTIPDNGVSGTGRTVEMRYDRATTTTFDAAGNKAVRIADTYGRTVRSEAYDGPTLYAWTVTTYDGAGRVLTTEQNDNPHTRVTNTYDVLGRKIAVIDPDSGTWTYQYDAAGNLMFANDPHAEQHVEYCYDPLNRPIAKAYFDDDVRHGACTGDRTIRYTYDQTTYVPGPGQPVLGNLGIGRPTQVDDLSGSVRYRYDGRGRAVATSRTISLPNEPNTTAAVDIEFDAADRVWKSHYPDGEVSTAVYDATGQPRKLSTQAGAETTTIVTRLCTDLLGRTASLTHGNAVTDTLQYYGQPGSGAFAYGHALRTVTTHHSGASDNYLDIEYQQYDPRGLLTALYDHRDGTAPLSNSATYQYDFAGRLRRITGPSVSESYEYDPLGNLASKGGGLLAYSTAHPHQPTTYGGQLLEHDDNGNRTGKGSHQYAYDADDHLLDIDSGLVRFAYDYAGRRVAKITAGGVARYYGDLVEASSDGTLTKHYVLGGLVVASRRDPNSQFAALVDDAIRVAGRSMLEPPAVVLVLRRDVQVAVAAAIALGSLGLVLVPSRRRRPVVGTPVKPTHALGLALAVAAATAPWPIVFLPTPAWACGPAPPPIVHYHRDHLGSTQAITDASGVLVRSVRYKPYGTPRRYLRDGHPAAADERYRREFTGYETESLSGLEYAGARFYDPDLGLFTTHDPAHQFASPYTYTNWDPVNRTDPNGALIEWLFALTVLAPLIIGLANGIDTGVRTGDPQAALGAFGAGFTIGSVGAGLGTVGWAAATVVSNAFGYLVAAAGLGYGAYSSVDAGLQGYYASAVVGLGLTAVGAAGLAASGTDEWQTGRFWQARTAQGHGAGRQFAADSSGLSDASNDVRTSGLGEVPELNVRDLQPGNVLLTGDGGSASFLKGVGRYGHAAIVIGRDGQVVTVLSSDEGGIYIHDNSAPFVGGRSYDVFEIGGLDIDTLQRFAYGLTLNGGISQYLGNAGGNLCSSTCATAIARAGGPQVAPMIGNIVTPNQLASAFGPPVGRVYIPLLGAP
jgi:RHS repeat-associated protein